jgi:hypothetical protein
VLTSGITAYVFGGFSQIYIIPAVLIVGMLFFILSPITSITMVLIGDPLTAPVGWILLGFFAVVTALGIVEFIRGGET